MEFRFLRRFSFHDFRRREMGGAEQSLLAFPEGEGLFIVLRDTTSSKTTYGAGRFLSVEKKPEVGGKVTLDFNRAYNPPCAFSKFTTCPLAPKQNHLPIAISAGEKLPAKS